MRFAVVLVVVMFAVSAAVAKDFRPGDLRVCNAKTCVPITDRATLATLSSFYYTGAVPRIAVAPPLGVPSFELRFRHGYVTGVVASATLDRFLSYGVNLDRFEPGIWYQVPARAAGELRALTAKLRPLPLRTQG